MTHKPWYVPTRWPDGSDKPKAMGTILNEVLHRLERIEKTPKKPDDRSTNRLVGLTDEEILDIREHTRLDNLYDDIVDESTRRGLDK